MKIASVFLIISFLFNDLLNAQDITNTLGINGKFKIKDGMTEYLKLSQTTGDLSLFRNLELIGEETDSLTTVIKLNGQRFIHNFKGVGTDGYNTFVGLNSGNFTMGGAYTGAGSRNTGVGHSTLTSNTTGTENSAFGDQVLNSNTTGSGNSSFGSSSLFANTTGYNNSAFGVASLVNLSDGNYNSAFGYLSMVFGYWGSYNSAFGSYSLSNDNYAGNYNTAIGYMAGSNITNGNNNIAIGYNATVTNGNNDNQIRLGNNEITVATVQVPWSITSDIRWKENIQSSNLGLDFISKLNPVSYTRKNDDNHKREYGLVAQELEKVLKDEGIENAGILTITDDGFYELRYNDLFAPMIKAIQELSEELHSEKKKNEQLASALDGLENKKNEEIAELKNRLAKYEEFQSMIVKELNQIKSNQQHLNVQLVNAEGSKH